MSSRYRKSCGNQDLRRGELTRGGPWALGPGDGLCRVVASHPFPSGSPGEFRCAALLPPAGGAEETAGERFGEQSPRRSVPESGRRLPLSQSPAARLRDVLEAESGTRSLGETFPPLHRLHGPILPGSAGAEGAGPRSASGGGGRGLGRLPERRGRAWRRRRRWERRGRAM